MLTEGADRIQRMVEFRERMDALRRVTEGIPQTDSVELLREDRTTLKEKSIGELLALNVAVLKELRARRVLRTENNPTGDLAEYLFCAAYGWKSEPGKALDATDADGKRYQIKGCRLAGRNPSRQLSPIRDPDGFDILAAVLFDDLYHVKRAALIPVRVVHDCARYVQRTNSFAFVLRDQVWDKLGVVDATDRLRQQEALDG